MLAILQIFGALLILAAFMATQTDRISPHSVAYLTLNLIGSVILAGLALDSEDWGFVLLEGVWAIGSAYGLLQQLRGAEPA